MDEQESLGVCALASHAIGLGHVAVWKVGCDEEVEALYERTAIMQYLVYGRKGDKGEEEDKKDST